MRVLLYALVSACSNDGIETSLMPRHGWPIVTEEGTKFPAPSFTVWTLINSNDFGRFGNYLADSNSNFVVVEIIFFL